MTRLQLYKRRNSEMLNVMRQLRDGFDECAQCPTPTVEMCKACPWDMMLELLDEYDKVVDDD